MKKRLTNFLYTLIGLGLAILAIWGINKIFLSQEITFSNQDKIKINLPENLEIDSELDNINRDPVLEIN